jgi:hypothetical protein
LCLEGELLEHKSSFIHLANNPIAEDAGVKIPVFMKLTSGRMCNGGKVGNKCNKQNIIMLVTSALEK